MKILTQFLFDFFNPTRRNFYSWSPSMFLKIRSLLSERRIPSFLYTFCLSNEDRRFYNFCYAGP